MVVMVVVVMMSVGCRRWPGSCCMGLSDRRLWGAAGGIRARRGGRRGGRRRGLVLRAARRAGAAATVLLAGRPRRLAAGPLSSAGPRLAAGHLAGGRAGRRLLLATSAGALGSLGGCWRPVGLFVGRLGGGGLTFRLAGFRLAIECLFAFHRRLLLELRALDGTLSASFHHSWRHCGLAVVVVVDEAGASACAELALGAARRGPRLGVGGGHGGAVGGARDHSANGGAGAGGWTAVGQQVLVRQIDSGPGVVCVQRGAPRYERRSHAAGGRAQSRAARSCARRRGGATCCLARRGPKAVQVGRGTARHGGRRAGRCSRRRQAGRKVCKVGATRTAHLRRAGQVARRQGGRRHPRGDLVRVQLARIGADGQRPRQVLHGHYASPLLGQLGPGLGVRIKHGKVGHDNGHCVCVFAAVIV